MPMTVAQFKAKFPEFNGAPDALVQSRLDESYETCPANVWGARQDQGASWLAAHLMSRLPQARRMRIDGADDLYHARYRQLQRSVAGGFRTVYQPRSTP